MRYQRYLVLFAPPSTQDFASRREQSEVSHSGQSWWLMLPSGCQVVAKWLPGCGGLVLQLVEVECRCFAAVSLHLFVCETLASPRQVNH